MDQHPPAPPQEKHRHPSRPYLLFWANMVPGLAVMYAAMFAMIDTTGDFRNNVNMLWMALTMWAPMGILMLATMPGMFPDRRLNLALALLLVLVTAASFMATRRQALVGDRQFVASMIPHHSGAILMCRAAQLSDPGLVALCAQISRGQREEIERMNAIAARLRAD